MRWLADQAIGGLVSKSIRGDLPKNSWVSWVQAGNFDAGTAYAAFDRHTFGDFAPYVFRTTDYGKQQVVATVPAMGATK